MAFPFAMIIAVDAIRKHEEVAPHVERAAAVKLATIAMLLTLVFNGLVVPYATQYWQKVTTPPGWNVPQPAYTQLSTPALLTHPERHDPIVPHQYTRAGVMRHELIQRGFMSLIPAMFIWLRWSAWSQPRRRKLWPLPASAMTVLVSVVFFATLLGGFRIEMQWGLPPGSGQVPTLIVFTVWSLLEQRFAQRQWREASIADLA